MVIRLKQFAENKDPNARNAPGLIFKTRLFLNFIDLKLKILPLNPEANEVVDDDILVQTIFIKDINQFAFVMKNTARVLETIDQQDPL